MGAFFINQCPKCPHTKNEHGVSGCLYWNGTLCPCLIPKEHVPDKKG